MISHLLICGLGSIGRRHLRHFRALGVPRIDAFRTGMATLSDEEQPQPDRTFGYLDEALRAKPQACIIASPSSLHEQTALRCLESDIPVLIEKPVALSVEGCKRLIAVSDSRGVLAAAAHNLRYHPALRVIRKGALAGRFGKPYVAEAHSGVFVPEWHPWEDFRRSYVARRELGGGAAYTCIHEIDYLLWLFGPVRRVRILVSRLRPLGTDVDEATAALVDHTSGVLATLLLCLFERPRRRCLAITFERGSAEADFLTTRVVWRSADGGVQSDGSSEPFDFDETYREQAYDFLRALDGTHTELVTLAEAAEAIGVAERVNEELDAELAV